MTKRDEMDKAGLFTELRRMARTSTAVGGVATRVLANRFGIKTNQEVHANALRAALGNLKGPLMKGAQLLSTIPGVLPDDYARELAELQSNAPPMGRSFVRRRMSNELGDDWEKKFRHFEYEASFAASLGQVHRATTIEGREVACKLQYPDMQAAVESDLRQFKLGVGVLHQILPAIRQDEVLLELENRLREELDYTREAAHMRLYRDMLKEVHDVVVPESIATYSTRRLLTMEWVEGQSIRSFIDSDPPQEARNRVARALFNAWYTPVYRYGVIHGDPHLGNFTVAPDGRVNLLDFGAVRIFPARFIQGIVDLFTALEADNDELAHAAYGAWGFDNLSRDTAAVLNQWARFVYGPLLDDRERPIQEDDSPNFGKDIAESVYDGLKRNGGVRPPREFVLVDRSAIGLGSVFVRLKASVNWHRLFATLIENFDPNDLAKRQEEALTKADVPPPLP